jgi:hypothetical protein
MQNRQCLRSTRNLYHMDFFIDNRLMYNVVLHVASLSDAFSHSALPKCNIPDRVSLLISHNSVSCRDYHKNDMALPMRNSRQALWNKVIAFVKE